jgi:hypothetical protein
MKVIRPIAVTASNYIKSPTDYGYQNTGDYAEWNIATAYTVGQRVIVDSLKSTFECVLNDTGTAPTLTMTSPWVRIGATNAWKPFDGAVGNQLIGYAGGTQAVDSMIFRLYGMGRFSAVAVLGTDASRVRVQYFDPDGVQTYNVVKYAVDTTPVVDAWTYCFADLGVRRDFVFDGIDGWGTSASTYLQIVVSNDATGVAVRVGEILIGIATQIGDTHAGVNLGLVDYSRKETNDYGDVSIIERAYSYSGSCEIEIEKQYRSRAQRLIAELRATPCVFFPSEDDADDGIVLYGFPTDFTITYETPQRAYASLEVEGLT